MWSIGSMALVVAAAVIGSTALAQYPNAGLAGTLMVGARGASSNMDFYYVDVAFDPSGFAWKVVTNLFRALFPSGLSAASVYIPCMLLYLSGFALALRRRETWLISIHVVAGFVWLATCILFQPQSRYAFMLAPLGAATLPAVLEWVTSAQRGRIVHGVLMAAAALSVGISLVLALTYRSGALHDREVVPVLAAAAGADTGGSVMSTSGAAVDIPLAYALAPRCVLSVDPQVNSLDDVATWMTALDVRVVYGTAADERFIRSIGQRLEPAVSLRPIGDTTSPAGQVRLWKVVNSR
jgi:hypothetical protein